MAKRRILKKNINGICGELFLSCAFLAGQNPTAEKKEQANKILTDIINLQKDIISRVSHTEPGSVKPFYKKLKEDFNKGVEEIIDNIGKLEE
ncbi:MAG: hypothetical protein H9789_05480 [Candidatus Paraprevotella stercoravium]|jgi:hypothetical protein|uniref:Uncharacterized protein n=1 Tax=Candidatus Paraprevotella stercoravium TaxID=2838725 RepID=A0A9E2L7P4_9BACT|nr:hypothetical protein [Candidatus Paraprevotella stercoravium]